MLKIDCSVGFWQTDLVFILIFVFIINAKTQNQHEKGGIKQIYNARKLQMTVLEVAKFKAYKSSNIHNDSVLEVSENTLITKRLMASKKNLGIGF